MLTLVKKNSRFGSNLIRWFNQNKSIFQNCIGYNGRCVREKNNTFTRKKLQICEKNKTKKDLHERK